MRAHRSCIVPRRSHIPLHAPDADTEPLRNIAMNQNRITRRRGLDALARAFLPLGAAALTLVLCGPFSATRGADRVPTAATEGGNTAAVPAPATLALYRSRCMSCHDADGTGEIGRDLSGEIPDFTNQRWQSSRHDDQLSHAILEGKGRSMPAQKARVGRPEAVRLVALVRSFGGGRLTIAETEEEPPAAPRTAARPEPAPAKPAAVDAAALFRGLCQRCHGPRGQGEPLRGTVRGMPDFTTEAWQGRNHRGRLTASILEGRGNGMPAFRDKLKRAEIDALVSFIAQLGPQREAPADAFEAQLADLRREFEALRRAYRELVP